MSNCQLKKPIKTKCPKQNKCNGTYSTHDTIISKYGKYYSTPNSNNKVTSNNNQPGKLYNNAIFDCVSESTCMQSTYNDLSKMNKKTDSAKLYSGKLYDCPSETTCMLNTYNEIPNIPPLSYTIHDNSYVGLADDDNDLFSFNKTASSSHDLYPFNDLKNKCNLK